MSRKCLIKKMLINKSKPVFYLYIRILKMNAHYDVWAKRSGFVGLDPPILQASEVFVLTKLRQDGQHW